MIPLISSGTRVLLAADAPRTQDTGLGRHQWFLARELERLGFAVSEFTSDDLPQRGPAFLRRATFPWAVLRRLRQGLFDAAVMHEGCAGLACLARRMGLVRAPCIVVSHNPEQKIWRRYLALARHGVHHVPFKSRISWPLTRLWLSNAALRLADAVVCLSAEDQSYLRQRYPRQPIYRMANGVRVEDFAPAALAGPPRILFLGSWLPVKGIRELRPALGGVLADFPEATCSLLGVGREESTVLEEFPLGIRARIAVRSRVQPEQLPAHIAAHNIFVLPSWSEGMPLSLLEAMAGGLAVVATEVGGMADVVRPGVDGLRVPAHDARELQGALARLCADEPLRASLGRAARQRAASFTWEAAGRALAEIVRATPRQRAAMPPGATQAETLQRPAL